MFRWANDNQASITRAWEELERAVGSLRGRKFYGEFDPGTLEYRACVELHEGDDPDAFGLELGRLQGGRYVRARLAGEPPAVYGQIAPLFEALAQRSDCDMRRPSIEYYRRRDQIDLLAPVV
jgi:hypothetical protein